MNDKQTAAYTVYSFFAHCFVSRFIDTYKVYQYRPDNLYNNIDVKRSGEIITKETVCGADGAKCQRLVRPNNVEGLCFLKMLNYTRR